MKQIVLKTFFLAAIFSAGFFLRPVLLPVHFNFNFSSANVVANQSQQCVLEPSAKVPGFGLFPGRYRVLLKSEKDKSIIGRGTFRVSEKDGVVLKFRTKQSSSPQKVSSVNIQMFPLLEEEAVDAMFNR